MDRDCSDAVTFLGSVRQQEESSMMEIVEKTPVKYTPEGLSG